MSNQGSQFLHERNPNLHTSQEVQGVVDYLRANGEQIPNEPAHKIENYLGFLANQDYVNDGILTGNQVSIDRQIEAHVIKAEDVPESYFELQRRIAREQGHGDITITPDMREQLIEAMQTDQRAGLSKWVEYLGGNDGSYPNWFKQYTWSSVTKLGNYDKEKGEFLKRSKGTTAPYPELNREALAYVFDAVNKAKIKGEKPDDEQLQKLLQGANFGKLYAHAVHKLAPTSPELRKDVQGTWTKFEKSDDPRTARRLAGSLQGHGTGWCTAGESTAEIQLKGGDFYVYYTRDEEGKDTIPRVAVRMQGYEVAEVRGINHAQELEPEMADITAEKLKGLPGGEEYIQKAEDMKRLTEIENKINANPETALTKEEIVLLYEVERDIQGFGYERDPRIDEIRAKRNKKGDMGELAKNILPEIVRNQFQSAYEGYSKVAESLGIDSISSEQLQELYDAKESQWRRNGLFIYLAEQVTSYYNARPELVVTPNVVIGPNELWDLADKFQQELDAKFNQGDLTGPRTFIYDYMLQDERPDEDWSGKPSDGPVRFTIFPSNYDYSLYGKTPEEMASTLKERQKVMRDFNLRVPSVLDNVTYWHTLFAKGFNFADESVAEKTNVNHFDLPQKRSDSWVPTSHVAIAEPAGFDDDDNVDEWYFGNDNIMARYGSQSHHGKIAVG